MVARMIPVERSQSVEVWHDAVPPSLAQMREDRLIAVSVDVPRRFRVTVRGAEVPADWPSPIFPRPHAES
jgi:hypothetical protein